jgi:hypothetical protein
VKTYFLTLWLAVTADNPAFGTYAWNETSWAADGTLTCSANRAANGKQRRIAVVVLGEGGHLWSIPNSRTNFHGTYPEALNN